MNRFVGLAAAGTLVAGIGVWAPFDSLTLAQGRQQSPRTQSTVPDGDWRTINRDLAANRYSPLKDINTGNVASAEGGVDVSSWRRRLVRAARGRRRDVRLERRPRRGARRRYRQGDLGALAAASRRRPTPAPPPSDAQGARSAGGGGGGRGRGGPTGPTASQRGVGYWPGDGTLAPRILFMSGNRLIAVDAATGVLADGFGTMGAVTVGVPYGGTPTIYRNVAIIGAATGETPQGPPGNPRAFDVITGKKLWEF